MGNTLNLDTKGFDELIEKLDELGADVKKIITDALEQAGETIEEDTLEAVEKSNLPAKGIYSKGITRLSVTRSPKVVWSGSRAEIGVGFDYSKPGAGGYLITGTPKMQPDHALNKMYKGKKYMSDINKDMQEVFMDEIVKRMEK